MSASSSGSGPVAPAEPAVSVFIAAYNCGRYIGAAIESALAQTGVSVEILVVDDASTDDTVAMARTYESVGSVRVLVNDRNRGPSYSRNRAIAAARGRWVAQLDADDWFASGRLSALIDRGEGSGADLVADDMFLVEEPHLRATSTRLVDNGAPTGAPRLVTATDLVRFDLGSVKPVIRRQFIEDRGLAYPEDLRFGEDFLFLLRALAGGGRMLLVPAPMYHLRRGNTGSATTQRQRLLTAVAATTRRLIEAPELSRDRTLLAALQARLSHVERLATLADLTGLLKQGRLGAAAMAVLRRPGLVAALAMRLPGVVAIRGRRFLHRRRLATAQRPSHRARPDTSDSIR
jgi:succinoglycan biosynthesis protein ExoO